MFKRCRTHVPSRCSYAGQCGSVYANTAFVAVQGRFQEAFAEAALANNYRRPVIGYAADVERLGRREVDAFFRRRYTPRSLTIAVVGDVSAEQVQVAMPCLASRVCTSAVVKVLPQVPTHITELVAC